MSNKYTKAQLQTIVNEMGVSALFTINDIEYDLERNDEWDIKVQNEEALASAKGIIDETLDDIAKDDCELVEAFLQKLTDNIREELGKVVLK
jgi:hypothetical protein